MVDAPCAAHHVSSAATPALVCVTLTIAITNTFAALHLAQDCTQHVVMPAHSPAGKSVHRVE